MTGNGSKPLSQERVDQILELSRRGMPYMQIAEKVGVSTATVYKYRQENGLKVQGRELAEERRARVAELTKRGMSASLIADILKVTDRTVVRDRKVAGISQPGPRLLTPEEVEVVERLLDDGASLTEAARTIGRNRASLHHNNRFKGRAWTRQQVADYAALRRLERACG